MATINPPEPPPSVPCRFNEAYRGPCGAPSDNDWCDKHESLICCCCGKKATRSCPHTSSMVCGCSLCDECEHSPNGGGIHIPSVEAKAIRQARQVEEEAREASRHSPVQRVDAKGCAVNLFELLKGPDTAFEIVRGYFLELKHGLMGFFPAIFSDDQKRIVVTLDKELISKVWRMLEPRSSKLHSVLFYVVKGHNVAFAESSDRERSQQEYPLTEEEFDALTAQNDKPFEWASGLLNGTMNQDSFEHLIEKALVDPV